MTDTTSGAPREPILERAYERDVWAWLIATVGEDAARQGLTRLSPKQLSYPLNVVRALGLQDQLPEALCKPRADGAAPAKTVGKGAAAPRGDAKKKREPRPRLKSHYQSAQHLKALSAGAPHGFEIGLRNAATDDFCNAWTPRKAPGITSMSAAQIDAAVERIGRANGHGLNEDKPATDLGENKEHVYVRGHSAHSIVLVDDLQIESYHAMVRDGLVPAVLTETSPGNHQAWFVLPRVSVGGAEPSLPYPAGRSSRAVVAKYLAATYDGDMASADPYHYGRLAGFLNCKPKYGWQANGKTHYPFVTVVPGTDTGQVCDGKVYDLANQWDREVAEGTALHVAAAADVMVAQGQLSRDAHHQVYADGGSGRPHSSRIDSSVSALARLYAENAAKLGLPTDLSRRDWFISIVLARDGWAIDAIAQALMDCPLLDVARKKGNVHGYVMRTAVKAHLYAFLERHEKKTGEKQTHNAKLAQASKLADTWFADVLATASARDKTRGADTGRVDAEAPPELIVIDPRLKLDPQNAPDEIERQRQATQRRIAFLTRMASGA